MVKLGLYIYVGPEPSFVLTVSIFGLVDGESIQNIIQFKPFNLHVKEQWNWESTTQLGGTIVHHPYLSLVGPTLAAKHRNHLLDGIFYLIGELWK